MQADQVPLVLVAPGMAGLGGGGHTAQMIPGDKCRVRDPENRKTPGSLPQLYFKPIFQIRFADASSTRWGIWRTMERLSSMC